jgi:hypothetical protein
MLLEEDKQATMLTAKVGEYVVFNCPLDFPHDHVIPYILRWNKEVIYLISVLNTSAVQHRLEPSVPS